MKKPTLQERASKCFSPWSWLAGYRAGRRDARKLPHPLRTKLQKALKNANEQHERARKAEHEANIVRLKHERMCIEMRRKEHELRLTASRNDERRAAMLQSRLPLNNGGFSR